MSPPMIAAIAALVTSLGAAVGVVANYIRSASNVGLGYLERALARMEQEIHEQNKTIGSLEAKLATCEAQHVTKDKHIREQDKVIAQLQQRVAALEGA